MADLNKRNLSFANISVLSLTPQVRCKLEKSGLRSVADLQIMRAGELILHGNLGLRSLRAVRRALADLGLCLRDDEDPCHKKPSSVRKKQRNTGMAPD